MIRHKDIIDKANEWDVPRDTVDKDYVLGHFIDSFYTFEENRSLFVFKGGTCLRKCYFPYYRFSEDLDFTVTDKNFNISISFLKRIADECTKKSGILFGNVKEKPKKVHDDNKFHVIEFVIPFWGANHPKKNLPIPQTEWQTRIELDFSSYENILTPIEYRGIHHHYNDILQTNVIPVYSLKEIFTEKIRSFEQRRYKAVRDYYDVWYIMQNANFENWDEIRSLLIEKCKDKDVILNPFMFHDDNRKYDLQKSWSSSIKNQLSDLPEFESVWFYLKDNLFQKLKLI